VRRLIALGLGYLVLASPAAARQGSAGTTAGNTVLRGNVGARPAALGGAFTAAAEGPLALRYNPAALGSTARPGIFLQYQSSFLDIGRGDLAYAAPAWDGGFAIGVSTVDYGSITRTTTANKTGVSTFEANDYLLRAGFGRAVSDRISLGGSLAYYRLELDNVSADGFTADLAGPWRPEIEGLRAGFAVRNIGTRARFQAAEEELPLTLAFAAAYDPIERLTISTDYELVRGAGGAVKAGVEFRPADHLALRVGYDGRNEAGSGLAVGGGFRMNDLAVDYAYVPFGDLGDDHRVSLEWSWGAPREMPDRSARLLSEPAESARPGAIKPTVSRRVLPTVPPPAVSASPDEERYASALTREPSDANAHYNLATLYYRRGAYSSAAEHFESVTKLSPGDGEAWMFLGLSLERTGRTREAEDALATAALLMPENAYLQSRRGR
jgi:opacity protein-like surface antigen